jgi:hypothetical protein
MTIQSDIKQRGYYTLKEIAQRTVDLEDTLSDLLNLVDDIAGADAHKSEIYQRAREILAQKI